MTVRWSSWVKLSAGCLTALLLLCALGTGAAGAASTQKAARAATTLKATSAAATHKTRAAAHASKQTRRGRVPSPPTPPPTPTPPPSSSPRSLYWGAWIGSQLTGSEAPWDLSAIAAFEHETGKNVSLVNFSSPWQNCYSNPCRSYDFDTAAMNNIRESGAIPFFSWGSDSVPFSVNEPNFSLASIIAGKWDSYVTNWATAAKSWGHPFFLRFDWEMNANWFPWGVGVGGNTSAQYVQAWQHVHDIFTSVGATNVTWVWCPNVDPAGKYAPLASVYPGDGVRRLDRPRRLQLGRALDDVQPGLPVDLQPARDDASRRASRS